MGFLDFFMFFLCIILSIFLKCCTIIPQSSDFYQQKCIGFLIYLRLHFLGGLVKINNLSESRIYRFKNYVVSLCYRLLGTRFEN